MRKIALTLVLAALAGCNTSDEEIRADIASKARQNLEFAGLQYTVKNATANFTGSCPSKTAFEKIKKTIKNIHVIKAAIYNIKLKPVTIDELMPLKQTTDSILAQYPQVIADVRKDSVTLKGSISAKAKLKLLQTLTQQNLGFVIDSTIEISK
jgi:hypothetical protein